jgi:hypothetical protein
MAAETPTPAAPPLPELLTQKLILSRVLPIGARTFGRWLSSGTFPPADLAIGGKTRLWKRATVLGWVDAQAQEGGAR